MKVIENKDCRVIAVVMQGIVITEYSGVIMQIDQSVIKRAADELGLFNTTIVRDPDEVEKLATQLESALSTCKQADETIKEKDKTIEALRKDIASDNQLINELEFQRNSAKDFVTKLKKQVEELLVTITEKNEIIGKLSKRIEDDTSRV